MSYTAPIGTVEERETSKIWPGRWVDATGYDKLYGLGYHTGADLNLNFPYWDADQHKEVYAIGEGEVAYAQIFPNPNYWGGIIVINHGEVDDKPLFSRYAHVENIIVDVGDPVNTGDPIALVGNGEGLFPYHLHFDMSHTEILSTKAWHWPGTNRAMVREHYLNPQEWLQTHVPDGNKEMKKLISKVFYVVITLGLRVREAPGLEGKPVGALPFGARVFVERTETVKKDSYEWGRIIGGMFDGDWLAMGSSDGSEIFISRHPYGPI